MVDTSCMRGYSFSLELSKSWSYTEDVSIAHRLLSFVQVTVRATRVTVFVESGTGHNLVPRETAQDPETNNNNNNNNNNALYLCRKPVAFI